ncbi:MAG: aminopeptidase N [Propionibacteriaceae bacterium]
MPSLLRTEAHERAELITVAGTHLRLDLTGADVAATTSFTSTSTITFRCSRPGAGTFVDFKGESLAEATLNGVAVDPAGWQDGRIPLTDLRAENELVITATMTYSDDGEGLHRHVDPADGQAYLYAMSFLDAGPRWFGCFDQPDLKSTYTAEVIAPQSWTVLGNGPMTRAAPGRWSMAETPPLSSYYVTLVAGPYASVYAEHDGIRLGVHCRASLGDELTAEADDILAVTRACFDHYHRMFGVRYPFGEYHQAFVPDFNAGAMENPGCVTFRDAYIFRAAATEAERAGRAVTIAHELAHMWFGDLVTMRWWDDLWLNESFAEYMACRACTEVTRYEAWTDFGITRKDWGSVADQAPSTHPVAGNGSADAQAALADFDGISYAKGAAVLKQLAARFGDEVFLSGLRHYFEAHRFGNADLADLLGAWTRAGAQALEEWTDGWLREAGMDTLAPVRTQDGAVLVRTPPVGQSGREHAVRVVALTQSGVEVDSAAVTVDGAETPLPLPADAILVPDAGDDTWARIRLADGDWNRLPPLSALSPATVRTVLHNSLRDSVRDGALAPATALDIIVSAVADEADAQVVQSGLGFALRQLAGPYAAAAERAERRARVHVVAQRLVDTAEPGSDRQLIGFRALVASSDAPERLLDWWAGSGWPNGVAPDLELGWQVVQRLATLGAGDDVIEEALDRDRSAQAEVHAARARALRPDPAAKEAAFALLVEPSGLSAYELYATAQGLFPPEQDELTAHWVRPYFERIDDTAAFRGGWALARVALDAFPALPQRRGSPRWGGADARPGPASGGPSIRG